MIYHGLADLMDMVRKGCRVATLCIDDVKVPIFVEHLEYEVEQDFLDRRVMGKLDFSVIDARTSAYYLNKDSVMTTRQVLDILKKYTEEEKMTSTKLDKSRPGWSIKQVIFNDPATIVYWHDGTKTVVKCENEVYDPEKGLAMALAKKMLGNKGNYFDVFRKWLPEDYETPSAKKEAKPWKIWYRQYDVNTRKRVDSGVYFVTYKRKGDAVRAANKLFGDPLLYEVIVSMANPWKEV